MNFRSSGQYRLQRKGIERKLIPALIKQQAQQSVEWKSGSDSVFWARSTCWGQPSWRIRRMEAGARGSGRSGRRTDRTAPSATLGCCSCACSLEDDKTADQKMCQNKVTTINNSIYFLLRGSSTRQQKDCREISGWTGAYDLAANEPWWDSDLVKPW